MTRDAFERWAGVRPEFAAEHRPPIPVVNDEPADLHPDALDGPPELSTIQVAFGTGPLGTVMPFGTRPPHSAQGHSA